MPTFYYSVNPDGSVTLKEKQIVGTISQPIGGTIETNVLRESLQESIDQGKPVTVGGIAQGIGTPPYTYEVTPSSALVSNVTKTVVKEQPVEGQPETQTKTVERTVSYPTNTIGLATNEKEVTRKYVGGGVYEILYSTPQGNITRSVYDPTFKDETTAEYILRDIRETFTPKLDVPFLTGAIGTAFSVVTLPASLFSFNLELAKIKDPTDKAKFTAGLVTSGLTSTYNYATEKPFNFITNLAGSMAVNKMIFDAGRDIYTGIKQPETIGSQATNTLDIFNRAEEQAFSGFGSTKIATPPKNTITTADYDLTGKQVHTNTGLKDATVKATTGQARSIMERTDLENIVRGDSRIYTIQDTNLGSVSNIGLGKTGGFKDLTSLTGQVGKIGEKSTTSVSLAQKLGGGPNSKVDIFLDISASKVEGIKDTFATKSITNVFKHSIDSIDSGTSGGVISTSKLTFDKLSLDTKLLDIHNEFMATTGKISTPTIPTFIGSSRTDTVTEPKVNTFTIKETRIIERQSQITVPKIEEKTIDLPVLKSLNLPSEILRTRELTVPVSIEITKTRELTQQITQPVEVQTQIERQITRLDVPTIQETKITTPPTIFVPVIPTPDISFPTPSFDFYSDLNMGRAINTKITYPDLAYKPSFEAIVLNIKSPKIPDIVTGFGLRPIPTTPKKRHKKRRKK